MKIRGSCLGIGAPNQSSRLSILGRIWTYYQPSMAKACLRSLVVPPLRRQQTCEKSQIRLISRKQHETSAITAVRCERNAPATSDSQSHHDSFLWQPKGLVASPQAFRYPKKAPQRFNGLNATKHCCQRVQRQRPVQGHLVGLIFHVTHFAFFQEVSGDNLQSTSGSGLKGGLHFGRSGTAVRPKRCEKRMRVSVVIQGKAVVGTNKH